MGIYLKKMKTLIQEDICTPMFTAVHLAIVNNAEIYIGMQTFLQDPDFISLDIFLSGIGGSYGGCAFNFFRNLHIVFHSGYTHLYFY